MRIKAHLAERDKVSAVSVVRWKRMALVRMDALSMEALSYRRHGAWLAVAGILSLLAGCTRPPPPPLTSPYPNPRSIVIMPLLNQSPSDQFDTIAVTDTLVDELSEVKGLVVLPTNRALKILLTHGRTHATDVNQALAIAGELGVDGVLVGAITEYKPYSPQKVGMVLQLYWLRADTNSETIDPVRLSRQASGAGETYYAGGGPASQVQELFDASRNEVSDMVYAYGRNHQGQDSPYGWRRYLVDSGAYMHFVCHEMIVRLMEQELNRITVPVQTD
jgi:hypothetical protein